MLARGVPFPIRAGDDSSLNAPIAPARRNVRAAAQVEKLALAIERQRRMVGQALLDVLDFERLTQIAADGERLVARLFQPLERLVRA